MALTWTEVESGNAYKSLSVPEQIRAKKEYFLDVVVPKARAQGLLDQDILNAETEFFGGVATTDEEVAFVGNKQEFGSTSDIARQQLLRGTAGTLGMPVDLVKFASEVSFGGEELKEATIPASSKWWEEVFGVGNLSPRGSTQEFVGTVATYAGAGSPISAGRGVAKKKLIEFGKWAGLDVAAGLGGAMGREVGGEMGSPLAGELVGSFGTSVFVPSVVTQRRGALKQVREALESADSSTGKFITAGATRQLGEELSAELPFLNSIDANTPEGMALERVYRQQTEMAERTKYLEGKTPGVKLTLAGQTGSPAIYAREEELAKRNIINLSERLSKDASNLAALETRVESTLPSTTISESVAVRRSARDLTMGQRQIDDEIESISAKQADLFSTDPDYSSVLSGRALKDERIRLLKAAKERVEELAAPVNKLSRGVFLDASGIKQTVEEARKNPLFSVAPEHTPQIFSRIENAAQDQFSHATFDDVRAWREAVTSDIGQEISRGGADRRRLRSLLQIRNEIDTTLDQLKNSNPELRRAYSDFIEYYREDFAPRFYKGINWKMSQSNALGEDRILNERMVREYFKTPTNMARFVTLYGDSPTAHKVLENGILDMIQKRYTDSTTGALNVRSYQKFLRENRELLRYVPNLERRLLDAGNVAEALAERRSFLRDYSEQISDNILMKFTRGDKNVDAVFDSMMKSPREATRILYFAGKEEKEAFASGLMSRIFSASRNESGHLDGTKITSILDANTRSLEIVFRSAWGKTRADQYLFDIREIAETADILSVGRGTISPNLRPDKAAKQFGFFGEMLSKIGITVPTFMSQTRAVQTGRTGIAYVIAVLGGQAHLKLTEDKIHAIEKEIFYNPEFAREIANMSREWKMQRPNMNKIADKFVKLVMNISGAEHYGKFMVPLAPKLGASERAQEPE